MNIDLRNGDALQLVKEIPDNSIDFICTDLPYGKLTESKDKAKQITNIKDTSWDCMLDLDVVMNQFKRIIKPNRAIALFGQCPFTLQMYNAAQKNGLTWKYNWIWGKKTGPGFACAKLRPLINYEEIMIFSKLENGSKIFYNPQGVSYVGKEKQKQLFFHKRTPQQYSSEDIFDQIIIPYFKGINDERVKDINFNSIIKTSTTSANGKSLQKFLKQITIHAGVSVSNCHGGLKLDKLLNDEYKDKGFQIDFKNKSLYRYIDVCTGYPKAILNFPKKKQSKHPTCKPVDLLKYLINTYTNEEETVLDLTMGSGSTGVAAKQLNRNFIGFQLTQLWFNVAKERIDKI